MRSVQTVKFILRTTAILALFFTGFGAHAAAQDQTMKAEQNATVAAQNPDQAQKAPARADSPHRHSMGMRNEYPEKGCPKAKMMTSRHEGGRQMMGGMKGGHGAGRMTSKGGMAAHGMMGTGMMRGMMSHMMGGPGGMDEMMAFSGCGQMPGRGPMDAAGRMLVDLEELNLTPEQWSRVRTLAREKLERMADHWAQQMKLRIELASLHWGAKMDAQQVKDAFVKEAEARAEMYLAGVEYMRGLKEILTSEQLELMEEQGSEVSGNSPANP